MLTLIYPLHEICSEAWGKVRKEENGGREADDCTPGAGMIPFLLGGRAFFIFESLACCFFYR
jgi:hypothetical protein